MTGRARINVSLTEDTLKKLDELAKHNGLTRSAYISARAHEDYARMVKSPFYEKREEESGDVPQNQ